MRIAVNIHCLHPPLTGIGHYTKHLLEKLVKHSEVDELIGLSHRGWHTESELKEILADTEGYQAEEGHFGDSLSSVLALKKILARVPGVKKLRTCLRTMLRNRATASVEDCDVNTEHSLSVARDGFLYWESNYLPLPQVANPTVLTIHDISHMRYPEFHPQSRLDELQALPRAIERAAGIIAVSNFTRTEIVECLGVSEDQIEVVTPAVDDCFVPQDKVACDELRRRYRLPANFILSVGTIEPRKNMVRLLHAYNKLPVETQVEFPLIIAGAMGWHGEEFEAVLAKIANDNIRRIGYVDSCDLPLLYSAASLFVYPSVYEGFGMPILEAMACGTPVVTSNVSSMPEVADGAAELVDPMKVDSIYMGLTTVILSEEMRVEMIEAGKKVAARYSWHRSTENLLNALQHFSGSESATL